MSDDVGIYKSDILRVSLEHEGAHQSDKDYKEFFNDMGFVIRGRTEDGHDFHLWSFMYQQRGPEIIVDGDVSQTLCIVTKFSDEEKLSMHDTPYINKGQNIEDYAKPGEIKITESEKETVWSTSDRKYICSPPHWRVEGDHAGVKTDIDYTESSEGFFHLGTFDTLKPEGGFAGYIMHGKAEGTITVKGKALKFKGFGVHERIIQSGIVADRTHYMGGRGLNWMHGFSDDFSWYCFKGDVGDKNFTGVINIGGKSFPVKGSDGGIEETFYWLDPKSKLMIPYRWKVWMETDKGRLESEVWGYARGYYTWIRKHGTMVVNQYTADSTSKFIHKDGRIITSPQMCMIEHMRTMYRQED
ncbi:hypothetical protein K432DRAFT_380396 [Lepidopterella palustris CBS 459.81]|uniref:AttH domain-containing protein n=1 Tax=Lepidopterella palustris CBS 459.81 TaxID=1314670 RepID=A0A8E2EEG8_9PEZI|nr:hypothetical protein K432DRAFT_380396 [Lepidopterella palustris CBS 459.81]